MTVTVTAVGGTTGKLTVVAASTFTPVTTLLAESLLLTFTGRVASVTPGLSARMIVFVPSVTPVIGTATLVWP